MTRMPFRPLCTPAISALLRCSFNETIVQIARALLARQNVHLSTANIARKRRFYRSLLLLFAPFIVCACACIKKHKLIVIARALLLEDSCLSTNRHFDRDFFFRLCVVFAILPQEEQLSLRVVKLGKIFALSTCPSAIKTLRA